MSDPLLRAVTLRYKVLRMSDYTAAVPSTRHRVDQPAGRAVALPAGLARPLLAHAAILGLAGDVLLRDGPTGAGFPIWVGLCAVGLTSLVWRADRNVPRETQGWLAVALFFALCMAWRESDSVRAFNALATVGALGIAAVTLSQGGTPMLLSRIREAVASAIGPALSTIRGILPLAARELFATAARDGWVARVRAALIVVVLLAVFGSLLTSADPIFASLVSLPAIDFEDAFTHVLLTGFFAWIWGGLATGALEESDGLPRRPGTLPFSLGMSDVTTALVTLNVLFATFILVQLGWMFGGETFLRDRTGLTAAEYARRGFFEMTWVVVLVLPLLLGMRAMLAPGQALLRRYTLLALPVIVLLGAIILSAAMRMKLYVHYFGLTVDRLNTLVFMGWLGFVLVWLSLTVMRGRERQFLAGAMISAIVMLAGRNVITPDRIVARTNVARAAAVDFEYLARLGGEAADVTVAALVAGVEAKDQDNRCAAAQRLLTKWGPERVEKPNAWRTWNAGERHAIAVVRENAASLRGVMHQAC